MDNDDDNADICDESFESVKEELILESSIEVIYSENLIRFSQTSLTKLTFLLKQWSYPQFQQT